MKRWLGFVVVLCAFGRAAAQDMPLHEIIKAGETWRPHSGQVVPPTLPYAIDGKTKCVVHSDRRDPVPLNEPSCLALWHNGGTLLVGDAGGKHLWAFRIGKDGALQAGDKYIPLRVRKGDERSEVSALCVDRSNRVYAATKEGIQIFDPTGRLCGVIVRPTPAKITALVFVGNELYALTADRTYVRTMTAQGPDAPK